MEHVQGRVGDGSAPSPANESLDRVRRIRAQLPGQVLRERIETVRARYGALYTLEEIRHKVGETLPMRLGSTRGAALEPIQTYREAIADEALLKYDEALRSGLFSTFWVATPAYHQARQADPWIVAEVTGTSLHAVVAQWH